MYLYEVQVRRGQLCSATRSSADGSFERGEFVLTPLLGVSAGRFVVEPDATPCRMDFESAAAQILKAPIERARAALNSISAAALVSVTRVHIATTTIEGYLGCTPEPARSLLDKIIAGASPRELITSGSVAPRLLEAVLSDVARRGAITRIEHVGDEPTALQSSSLPSLPLPAASPALAPKHAATPSLAPKADDVTAEDAGWFSLQLDSSHPPLAVGVPESVPESAPPVSQRPKGLPFSSEVTPAVDRRWDKITEGVFSDPGTLQGVGLPDVARAPSVLPAPIVAVPAVAPALTSPKPGSSEPAPPPMSPRPRAEELDALANALTAPSPIPARVAEPAFAEAAPVAGPPVSPPEAPEGPSAPEPATQDPVVLQSTLVSRIESQAPSAASSRVSALKTPPPPPRVPAAPNAQASSLIRFVFVAGAAFAVAYFVVSYYRMQSAPDAGAQPSVPAPLPATS